MNLKHFYIILILFSYHFFGQSKINESEITALKTLYNQTNGEEWLIKWDIDNDPIHWYGVKVYKGNIVELKLNGNGLKGTLPSLSSLEKLKKLDISSNQLQGNISFINNLTNLTYLDLSENYFDGDLSNDFNANINLEELHLGNNAFTVSQPDSFLQNQSNLTHLDISNFNLRKIPNPIRSLKKLISLNLNHNNLENNYSEIKDLKNIEALYLANNKISNLHQSLSELPNIKILSLEGNFFDNNLLSNLSSLKNIEWLSLENNLLTKIPNELNQLIKLIHLNVSRNKINAGFENLRNLNALQQLWLNNNEIEGNIPSVISQLPNLLIVSLSSNQLSGELPSRLPSITNIVNNKFNLNQLKSYLANHKTHTEILYSPQRYDEQKTINASLGNNVNLHQSLSKNEGYTINWFKNLDQPTNNFFETLQINNIKEDDYTQYTAEAYYINTSGEEVFEISFFREPITLEKSLATEEIKNK